MAGAGKITDNVVRCEEFQKRHPGVLITSPRQNGSFSWKATWTSVAADPEQDGAVCTAEHWDLGGLLNYLEAKFDRAGAQEAR